MPSSLASLNEFADGLVVRAGSVAWQWGALVILLALPAQWLLRGHTPALRYWVWQIVLLKLLVMPFWGFSLPVDWLPSPPDPTPIVIPEPTVPDPQVMARTLPSPAVDTPPDPAAAPIAASPSRALVAPSPRVAISAWLVIGWSGLLLLQMMRLRLQRYRFARLLVSAAPADPLLRAAVDEAAGALRLAKAPRVLLTEERVSPFVCGIVRPTLVLPALLPATLSRPQLRQVLLHELAHVRRHDLSWGWIAQIARMVWFFHPLVHWVVYRIRLERELACDQVAMTLSGHSAADYAQTLVAVVTQTSSSPPLSKGGPGGAHGRGPAPTCESATPTLEV